MLKKDDTLVLFGRSPFINEIKDIIPEIIDKYTTMACNYFCETFPNVDYVVFYDDICPKVKNSIIVTQKKYFTQKQYKCAQEIPDYPNKELYVVTRNEKEFTNIKGALHFSFHTPSMALNWAWQKGFKNVVLAGIDLINHTPHFDKDTTPDNAYPKWYDSDLVKAARYIENIAGRHLNIFQLNPKSPIKVKQLTVDDLLNENILIEVQHDERINNMNEVKIKVVSEIMLNGQVVSPTDKNGGVYVVEKNVANALISRKRAVLYTGEVKVTVVNKPEFDLKALKALADKLEVKYNDKIGGQKLNDRILEEVLSKKAEELKLDITGLDAIKANEVIENYKPEEKDGEDVVEEITLEELQEIAKEAEIDVAEDATKEELLEVVKGALEDYASELKLEIAEDETIKATWAKIQEKLQENDN